MRVPGRRARTKRPVFARYLLLLVGLLASVTFVHQIIYVEYHSSHELQTTATQLTATETSLENDIKTGGGGGRSHDSGRYLELDGDEVEGATERGGSSGGGGNIPMDQGGEKYVVITSAPAAVSNDTHPVFSFKTTTRVNNNCRVKAKLDDASSFTRVSSPHRVKKRMCEGWHTLQLACRRYPNNPTLFRWRIDLQPPKVRLLRTSSRITKDSTGFLVLESSERDCAFESHLEYKSEEGEPWRNALLQGKRHSKNNNSKPVTLARRRLTKHEVKILLDGLREGWYRYSVTATDSAGNKGAATRFDFIVDKTPPVLRILKTPKLIDTSRNATFLVESPSEGSTSDYTIEFKLDDLQWQAVNHSPLDQAYEIEIDDLIDGPHRILFRAKDVAGNVGEPPISFEWISQISTTETRIISGPARRSSAPSETFSIASSESKYGYSYVLDNGPVVWPEGRLKLVSGIRNFTVHGVGDGFHKIAISSVDVSGFEDQTPATYEWETDLSHPVCHFLSSPEKVVSSPLAFFKITCEEDYYLSYRLDASEMLAWDPDSSFLNVSETSMAMSGEVNKAGSSVNISLSALDEGTHKMTIFAFDSLMNKGQYTHDWVRNTNERPVVSFLVTPSKQSKSKKSKFKVASSKRDCSYQMRLDQGSWKNLENKKNKKAFEIKEIGEVGGLASVIELAVSTSTGFHTLELRATDAAGNDGEVRSYEWVVF